METWRLEPSQIHSFEDCLTQQYAAPLPLLKLQFFYSPILVAPHNIVWQAIQHCLLMGQKEGRKGEEKGNSIISCMSVCVPGYEVESSFPELLARMPAVTAFSLPFKYYTPEQNISFFKTMDNTHDLKQKLSFLLHIPQNNLIYPRQLLPQDVCHADSHILF